MTYKRREASLSVLKLGGSLLDLPDLANRLLHVIDFLQPTRAIVVVGGGQNADIVRDWDKRFHFDDAVAHDLAIYAMSLNARMVSRLHPRFRFSAEIPSADPPSSEEVSGHELSGEESTRVQPHSTATPHSPVTIVDSAELLKKLESTCLPSLHVRRSWDVTSDSIAAWMAHRVNAERLVLLKSGELPFNHVAEPAGTDTGAATGPETKSPESAEAKTAAITSIVEQLSAYDLVDADFAHHATKLPHLKWCNLRSRDLQQPACSVVDLW